MIVTIALVLITITGVAIAAINIWYVIQYSKLTYDAFKRDYKQTHARKEQLDKTWWSRNVIR